jgi:hypothetical protein
MSITISGRNLLQLWRLFISGKTEWPDLLRPRFENASERDELIEAGLLRLTKEIPDPESRKKIQEANSKKNKNKAKTPSETSPSPKEPRVSKPRAINRLYLTEKGCEYLLNHLSDPVSSLSPYVGPVFNWLLATLGKDPNVKAAMASILLKSKTTVPPPATHVLTPTALLNEIKMFDQNLFMPGGGLKISVIKQSLTQYSFQAIDSALLELESQDKIVLFPFDDPSRITPADKELCLQVSGVVRHYLFIK